MTDIEFNDCEYRFTENNELYCKNKERENNTCDNCVENIHLNCSNYNPNKDMCLKWFEENVSKNYKECQEKTIANARELQRKWSN